MLSSLLGFFFFPEGEGLTFLNPKNLSQQSYFFASVPTVCFAQDTNIMWMHNIAL